MDRIATEISLLRRPFLFVRHGQTDWNEARLCVGQVDRPLTDLGRHQARHLAERIRPQAASIVFHSPLNRAAETATILASRLMCSVECEPGLVEASMGEKEGCFEADPTNNFIADWLDGKHIPGAEAYTDFRRRVLDAANRCLGRAPRGVPMLVSHWAVHFALVQAAKGTTADIDHCVLHRFEPSDAGWVVTVIP